MEISVKMFAPIGLETYFYILKDFLYLGRISGTYPELNIKWSSPLSFTETIAQGSFYANNYNAAFSDGISR